MRGMLPHYAIVSPVRDEADLIKHTLDSVVTQTVVPDCWVIVDDGSTDATPSIVEQYAQRFPWIRLVKRANRGSYRLGGGVVEAFNEGLSYLDLDALDFVCKLDGDLRFEPNYFEQLLSYGAQDPKLGICSGVTFIQDGNRRVEESVPTFFAVGMAKLWRVSCFKDIGGLVPSLGWDVLDVVRAQMRGWTTQCFPALEIAHLRPMSSRNGWYRGRVRNGLTDYLLGYHPLFELGRCMLRMTKPPYVLGGACMLLGYITAWINREDRIVTPAEMQFLHHQQLGRLTRLQVR